MLLLTSVYKYREDCARETAAARGVLARLDGAQ